jgi:hypothetical protein
MGAAQEPPLSPIRALMRRIVCGMPPSVLGFADSTIIFYGYRPPPGRRSSVNLPTSVLLSSLISSIEELGGLTAMKRRPPATCLAAKRNADPRIWDGDALLHAGYYSGQERCRVGKANGSGLRLPCGKLCVPSKACCMVGIGASNSGLARVRHPKVSKPQPVALELLLSALQSSPLLKNLRQ